MRDEEGQVISTQFASINFRFKSAESECFLKVLTFCACFMEKLMKKKTKLLMIPFILLIFGLAVFCLLHPLVFIKSCYWIEDENGYMDMDFYKSSATEPEALLQQINPDQMFPSDDITDYCDVVLGISALNISPFNLSGFALIVDYQDENFKGVVVQPPVFPSQQGHRFSKVQERYMTSFLVYRNGRTDEEIVSELQNIEVILTYETLIKSYSKRMKLGDLSYQLMDDWYSYPKGWDAPVEEIPEGVEIIE